MAVTKRVRFEVLKRDNHACRYCGSMAPDVALTVDHVVPVALGGSDKPDNLVAACKDCNAGKASTSPTAEMVADVSQQALQWGRAIARFNQIRSLDRVERDEYVSTFDELWGIWTWGDGNKIPRASDWVVSLWQWHAAGLPIEEIDDAIIVACSNNRVHVDSTWRYFCGVVWRKLEEMHNGAAALLETGDLD